MTDNSQTDGKNRETLAALESDPRFQVISISSSGPVNFLAITDPIAEELTLTLDLRGVPEGQRPVACAECHRSLAPWIDFPSIVRTCESCGKQSFEASTQAGEGPSARKGDSVVVPTELIERNLSLTADATFTEFGVYSLARRLFAEPFGLAPRAADIEKNLLSLTERATALLDESPRLKDIDRHDQDGFQQALRLLRKNLGEPLLDALLVEMAGTRLREAVTSTSVESPHHVAALTWSAAINSVLLKFRGSFQEAAFRGASLQRLRRLIEAFRRNAGNDSEPFWQQMLTENPIAIGQLFAAPVVIHGERFFVGGVRAGGKHAKIADYLMKNRLTDAAAIVEIKTPTTRLLNESEYRTDVFTPTRELTGAVQQVLEQRAQFMKNIHSLQAELEADEPRVEGAEPQCVVIVGNAEQELNTRARRRSFEAYRGELRNVRVVTFDELFGKMEGLLGLLVQTKAAETNEHA